MAQGVTLWVYNFLMWIPTWAASGIPLVFLGLADLGFAVLIGFVVGYQSRFVPHSKVECGQVASTNYQVPAGNLSFFQAVGALNATGDTSPEDACDDFVDIWALGVAILVFLSLSGIANVVGGVVTAADKVRAGQKWRDVFKEMAKVLGYVLLVPPVLVFLIVRTVLQVLFALVRLVTPQSVQQRAVYAYLYGIKLLRRLPLPRPRQPRPPARFRWRFWQPPPPTPPMPAPAPPREKLARPPTPDEAARAQRLADRLPFDVLALLAARVHYVDLVNFSLAARPIRAAVFPPDDPARRERLRVYACEDGSKARCWGCGAQTCGACGAQRAFPDTRTACHLAKCRLRCAGCFYRTAVAERRPLGAAKCVCKVATGRRGDAAGPQIGHRVCRDCRALTNEELLALREQRDGEEARFLMQRGVSCGLCGVGLPERGPRWWVCEHCKKECRDRVHPAWGDKAVKMEV